MIRFELAKHLADLEMYEIKCYLAGFHAYGALCVECAAHANFLAEYQLQPRMSVLEMNYCGIPVYYDSSMPSDEVRTILSFGSELHRKDSRKVK